MRRICIIVVVAVLVFALAACNRFWGNDPLATLPAQITTEQTTPHQTTPEVTTPEETTPEETTPEATTPAVTEPDFSNTPDPDGTKRY